MGSPSNKEKWKKFLSSIYPKASSTNNSTIECLATTFANKLLKKDGIDSKNQPKTPITKGNMPLGEAEDESINNINEPAGKGARHELIDDRKDSDVSDTSDVKGRSAEINDVIIEEKPNIDETSRDTATPAGDSMLVLYGVDIVRSRDRDQPETDVKELSDDSIEEKPHIDETGDTKMPVDDDSFVRRRKRDTLTPSKKTKNEKGISCSLWNISNIAEYLNFDDCVAKLTMPTMSFHCLDDIYETVQKDICRILKVVRGIDLTGKKYSSYSALYKQLISITNIETGSRLVLDALLVSLCSVLDLQFEVEKKINNNDLPNCAYDYCILKKECIIGCIETKTVKTFSDDSIAQGILQLIILQKTLLDSKKSENSKFNISEFPVFAIVTDGHRFIYMQLNGSSLGFEHYQGRVRVREVGQECDFKAIIQHIIFLVDAAVSSAF